MDYKKYARWTKFIRDVVVDADYSKSNGQPNGTAFHRRFSAPQGSPLYVCPSTWLKQLSGVERDPDSRTIAGIAAMLSAAKGEEVTVGFLNGLIDRGESSLPIADIAPPSEGLSEEVVAERLFKDVQSLSIEARATIAPRLLDLLGRDWAYLDAPNIHRVGTLLQAEIKSRNLSLEEFRTTQLKGAISMEALKAIYNRRNPNPALTLEQVIAIQKAVRSIDGDKLDLDELSCLMS